jgi:hypothetical protein
MQRSRVIAIGIDEHNGWAKPVSVAISGGAVAVMDRRKVELIAPTCPPSRTITKPSG